MEWGPLLLLGAYHGINPGMGWLFAVALGMQQGSARGVWRALPPIALGHGVAVGIVLVVAAMARVVIPIETLRIVVAVMLVALGGIRLWRHRHPRYGGMQVGFRDLTIWSFLMASAHGAGVMVLPFILRLSTPVSAASHSHADVISSHATAGAGLMAVGLHTFSYLAVMGLLAWVVYSKLGLAFLRVAWFNLDWLWACALVLTGALVLLT